MATKDFSKKKKSGKQKMMGPLGLKGDMQ